MGTNEKFCLRWNDFESNISVAFREIREEKDFFDCTLSVGDRQLQAHKLILSACSPFFRSVLRKNPHQHPLIYLKGVEFSDLQSVLNFMYHGEVNVAQEGLNSFLAVAEDLKVKGLTQNNSPQEEDAVPKQTNQNLKIPTQMKPLSNPSVNVPPRYTSNTPRAVPSDPPASKRPRTTPQYPITTTQQDDDDIQEVMPLVKIEPVIESEQPPTVSTYQQSHVNLSTYTRKEEQGSSVALTQIEDQTVCGEEDGYDYGGYEEEYEGIEGTTEGSGSQGLSNYITRIEYDGVQQFSCLTCGKHFKDQSNCRRHVKTAHFAEMPEKFEVCGKIFKNKNSLKFHLRQYHPDFKYLDNS